MVLDPEAAAFPGVLTHINLVITCRGFIGSKIIRIKRFPDPESIDKEFLARFRVGFDVRPPLVVRPSCFLSQRVQSLKNNYDDENGQNDPNDWVFEDDCRNREDDHHQTS